MAVAAVTVALLLVGVPLAVLGSVMVWDAEQTTLDIRVQTLARAVDRRVSQGDSVDAAMLDP